MKNTLVFIFALLLFSCKQTKEDIICKKWHAREDVNPDEEKYFTDSQNFLDTFGKSNDDATNIKIYGFSNIDSARESLTTELRDYKNMKKHAIENTVFEFKKNKDIIMNFSGQVDSGKWHIDKEGKLIVEDINSKNNGNPIIMEIVNLTDTVLKLKYNDKTGTSTVTFYPHEK